MIPPPKSVNHGMGVSVCGVRLDGEMKTSPLAFYYAARFSAQIAQNLLFAALFINVGTSDQAGAGLSALLVATTAAALIFGVAGGALADRIGPGRGVALGAILRTTVIAVAFIGPGFPAFAPIMMFAYSAVSQVYSPSELAMVRVLMGKRRAVGHSLGIALQYAGQGSGMLVFAPLLFLAGGPAAMLSGAVVAGLVLCGFSIALAAHRGAPVHVPAADHSSIRDSLRVFKRSAPARDALAVLAVQAMVVQGIVVALPLYLRNDISLDGAWSLFLLAPAVAGVVAGLAWSAASVTAEGAARVMRAALLAMTVGVFALASLDYGLEAALEITRFGPLARLDVDLNTTFAVALPVAFLIGLALSLAMVSARVALSAAAPLGHQARVFAVQATLTDALVVLPLIMMGIGVEVAGARPVLAAMGLIGVLAFVVIEHPRFQPLPFPASEPAPVPVRNGASRLLKKRWQERGWG